MTAFFPGAAAAALVKAHRAAVRKLRSAALEPGSCTRCVATRNCQSAIVNPQLV